MGQDRERLLTPTVCWRIANRLSVPIVFDTKSKSEFTLVTARAGKELYYASERTKC